MVLQRGHPQWSGDLMHYALTIYWLCIKTRRWSGIRLLVEPCEKDANDLRPHGCFVFRLSKFNCDPMTRDLLDKWRNTIEITSQLGIINKCLKPNTQ